MAVMLVHHARKSAGHARAGQALRGSSELHAWGDSNLYLRRKGDQLQLTIEHRAAPSSGPIALELRSQGASLALQVIDPDTAVPRGKVVATRIMATIAEADGPLGVRRIRDACRIRTSTLVNELAALTAAGRIAKTRKGYCLPSA